MPTEEHIKQVRYRNILGFEGYFVGEDGTVWHNHYLLVQTTNKITRYRFVNLPGNSILTVHRLVLEAFLGPCPDGMACRHINGRRHDNRLENLAWGTPKENSQDMVQHGHSTRGSRNARAKLTAEQVREIRKRSTLGETQKALAKAFNTSRPNISIIVNKLTWAHI